MYTHKVKSPNVVHAWVTNKLYHELQLDRVPYNRTLLTCQTDINTSKVPRVPQPAQRLARSRHMARDHIVFDELFTAA